ncbi:MAG: quinone-dependent dihydroorotate dehydrogenase [Ornithinimicrobium sp.]|uniref:quinone-dependent dihydroorotate dehydrogenase n=1 Tax=Ornithinimicrobium sp. TaxID=1977084 RepID=UPI003D9B1007
MSTLRTRVLGAGYARLARPVLYRLDPEVAHHGTIRAVRLLGSTALTRAGTARLLGPGAPADGSSEVEVLGMGFRHRLGLAAGMDKDGTALAAWGPLGFGHVELGTVTALPQPGNPRPRMVRLPRSGALINRMGFNNEGVHALAGRLRAARARGLVDIPVGVSIGKSKATPVQRAVEDYVTSVRAVGDVADYLAVNVSSPNTPGLRSLQDAGPLRELLSAVVAEADRTPVLLKLAPDLGDPAVDEALGVALDTGVRGVIATNTTVSRAGVHPTERHTAEQSGGLSGAPLAPRSLEVVRRVADGAGLPVIGVGGIMTSDDAARMLDAGAALVQVYTGLVYAGPALVRQVAAL